MTRDRLMPVLLGVNGVLAAALAAWWLAPGPLAAWRQWQAPAPQPPALGDVQAARLPPNRRATAAYPQVAERPLMSATRRPAPPASAASAAASAAAAPPPPPPPPNPLDQAVLRGVIAGPALNGVMLQRDGKTEFIRRGQAVGDWTLARIQGRAAVFTHDGESRRMELPFVHGEAAAPGATTNATRRAAPPATSATSAPAGAASLSGGRPGRERPPRAAASSPPSSAAVQPAPPTAAMIGVGPAPNMPSVSARPPAGAGAPSAPRPAFGGRAPLPAASSP